MEEVTNTTTQRSHLHTSGVRTPLGSDRAGSLVASCTAMAEHSSSVSTTVVRQSKKEGYMYV